MVDVDSLSLLVSPPSRQPSATSRHGLFSVSALPGPLDDTYEAGAGTNVASRHARVGLALPVSAFFYRLRRAERRPAGPRRIDRVRRIFARLAQVGLALFPSQPTLHRELGRLRRRVRWRELHRRSDVDAGGGAGRQRAHDRYVPSSTRFLMLAQQTLT